MNNNKFWFYLLIAISLIFGIYFRFFNIETKVYWHDEVYTRFYIAGYQSREWLSDLFNNQIISIKDIQRYQYLSPEKGVQDILQVLAIDDPHHPPLYYIITHFWVKLFGDSVATIRGFSAGVSLLAFPPTYGLCLELFASSLVSLWAVALLAVSPFFVLYAQEAREYALLSVIFIFSNWTLLRAIRLTSPTVKLNNIANIFWAWLLYGLTLVLGFYTSLFTILLVVAQGTYIIICSPFRLTKNLIAYGITLAASLIAFLPWLWVFINNYEQYRRATSWASLIKITTVDTIKYLGLNVSRVFADFGFDFPHPLTWVIIISVSGLVLYSTYTLCSTTPLKVCSFILTLTIVPILLLIIPDLVMGGVRSLSARYLIPSWIGMILAVAYLLATQFNQRITRLLAVFVLSVGILSCSINAYKDTAWTKVISYSLPQVARVVNRYDAPLLVGNKTSYNPGNLIALTYLLKPAVKLQLLSTETGYILPQGFEEVFLLSPSEQLREKIEREAGVRVEWVWGDNHLWLWKINGIN